MKRYLFSFMLLILPVIFYNCQKPRLDEQTFYFSCKVNGQDYRPNGCTNCMSIRLLNDTALIVGANRGFESVGFGVYDYPVKTGIYYLNDSRNNADYDNSPDLYDIYKTDSIHTGQLNIELLDKTNMIIQGSFYFEGYNPVLDTIASVTEGKFRINYKLD